jgi:prepilin-type N-terminal cleavage/methylation domain-containing protein
MKNIQKGFTLVELIVVITILAILGTIAFISLQGYSQDAKNAKVASDLATLAKTIDIATTDGTLTLSSLVTATGTVNEVVATGTISLFSSENVRSTGALSAVTYEVGTVNFPALRQNGDDFKDPELNPYVAAVAYSGGTAYFQLAGQQKQASGEYIAIVKGNYIAQENDTVSLVSDKENTDPIINGANLGVADDDNDLY